MSNVQIPGLIQGKKTEADKLLSEAELQRERIEFAAAQKYQSSKDKMRAMSNMLNQSNNSIADSMTYSYELGLDQIKEMFPGQDVSRIANLANKSYVDHNNLTGQPYWGIDQNPNWLQPQPYQQPDEDFNKFFPQPKKYGPSPSRSNQDYQEELMKYLSASKKKSSFEEILDALFNQTEKEQFLITIGYKFENDYIYRDSLDETKDPFKWANNVDNINLLFLKEITVKFKILLLAKASLKLKLPEVKNDREN